VVWKHVDISGPNFRNRNKSVMFSELSEYFSFNFLRRTVWEKFGWDVETGRWMFCCYVCVYSKYRQGSFKSNQL
jgi:hypothetical protein